MCWWKWKFTKSIYIIKIVKEIILKLKILIIKFKLILRSQAFYHLCILWVLTSNDLSHILQSTRVYTTQMTSKSSYKTIYIIIKNNLRKQGQKIKNNLLWKEIRKHKIVKDYVFEREKLKKKVRKIETYKLSSRLLSVRF